MQIYKDMNIGTAKVTKEEMQGIKHYLVDYVSPDERYSVSQFKKDAENAIEKIIEKGKIPIIVGGTGLYLNSLIYNINYQDMEYDAEYRKELMEIAKSKEGLNKLYEEAKKIDYESAKKISENDSKRILRILEIYKQTGKTKTQMEKESKLEEIKYDYRVFVINWDRQTLYERINKRVDMMIEQGLVDEVVCLREKYNKYPTAMQAIGYKEVVEYLNGKLDYNEMKEKIKMETRRYAKRQITWFKKNKDMIWLKAEEGIENNINAILEEI